MDHYVVVLVQDESVHPIEREDGQEYDSDTEELATILGHFPLKITLFKKRRSIGLSSFTKKARTSSNMVGNMMSMVQPA